MRTLKIIGATALTLALILSPAMLSSASAGVEVGAEAPDVTASDYFNTEPLKLSDLKGRVILLELFGTT